MRILWLTPQLPYPPRQGATLRNFNLIRLMAARGHTIALATFLAPGETLAADSPLHQLCARIVALPQPQRSGLARLAATLFSPLPDMALRLESPAMHGVVADLVADFRPHLLQVEGIEMAQYGLAAAAGAAGPRLIFDNHNVEYLLQKRNALVDLRHPLRWHAAAYSLIQWAKLLRYERKLCQEAAGVVAVSPVDGAELARLAPDRLPRPVVVPNGIDLDNYPAQPPPVPPGPPILLFTGKMDYRPNVDAALWFGQRVLPLILAQEPSARFQIVGMNPHPRLERLRRHPAIEITGGVAQIQPYVDAAAVYVAPLRVGGGTRFKILEALASAKPVVSTPLGVEGLGVRHQQELLIGETPESFARHVVALLRSQAGDRLLARRLGWCARRFVDERYAWERLAPTLDQLYDLLCPTQGDSP